METGLISGLMNLKRGFFRLWIVSSVLFVGSLTFSCYDEVYSEFRRSYASTHPPDGFILEVPIDCKEARGKRPSADQFLARYQPGEMPSPNPFDQFDPPGADFSVHANEANCWYLISKFRDLYPEYKNLSDSALAETMYEKAGIPLKHFAPWTVLFHKLLFALGVPLAALAVGAALFWAVHGFRSKAT
jgi:hypothetical protein